MNGKTYTIRPVKPSDSVEIAAIYNEYVLNTTISFETDAISVPDMVARIENISCRYPYYVCETGGCVCGYCYAHPWKERAAYRHTLETTIYINRNSRHAGIGRMLMNKLIEDCRNLGFIALVACITADNTDSISMHSRLGFSQVSHFKNVGLKFGKKLDVIDMELLL